MRSLTTASTASPVTDCSENKQDEGENGEDIPLIPSTQGEEVTASHDSKSTTARQRRRRKTDDENVDDDDREDEGGNGEGCIVRTLQVYAALFLSLLLFAVAVKFALPWWKAAKAARRPVVPCHCWNVPRHRGSSSLLTQVLPAGRMCLMTSSIMRSGGWYGTKTTEPDYGFGHSVDISKDGTVIAIGTTSALDRGDVRILKYNSWKSKYTSMGGRGYRLLDPVHIHPTEFLSNSNFGDSVSLTSDGTILAVGRGNDWHTGGGIYVYNIHQKDKRNIVGEPTYIVRYNFTMFGKQHALSGDGNVLAVSGLCNSCQRDESLIGPDKMQGIVTIFRNYDGASSSEPNTNKTASWEKVGTDIVVPFSDQKGVHALALSGDGTTLAMSVTTRKKREPNENFSRPHHHVRIYHYHQQTDEWQTKGPDIETPSSKTLSLALSYNGNVVAMGEPSYVTTTNPDNATKLLGRVQVFEFHKSKELWSNVGAPIYATPDGSSIQFGFSISLSDDGMRLVGSTKNPKDSTTIEDGFIGMYELDQNNRTTWNTIWGITGNFLERKILTTDVAISGDGNSIVMGITSGEPWGKNVVLVYRMDHVN